MAITSPALRAGRQLPQYLRVAQWVMSLGRPVSRDEIAGYFGITARRAGDIMLYIDNAGARLIESERFLITGAHGREVALMRVTMVWPELYTPSRAGRPRGRFRVTRPPEPSAFPELRDLFLGRRVVRGTS
ncbi:CaiF/GrlA family transcriptional regulator [Enterobacter cloacae]|nr:CaiF/GrlA family transcriptional regulator [Enterobacter cloacae]